MYILDMFQEAKFNYALTILSVRNQDNSYQSGMSICDMWMKNCERRVTDDRKSRVAANEGKNYYYCFKAVITD